MPDTFLYRAEIPAPQSDELNATRLSDGVRVKQNYARSSRTHARSHQREVDESRQPPGHGVPVSYLE